MHIRGVDPRRKGRNVGGAGSDMSVAYWLGNDACPAFAAFNRVAQGDEFAFLSAAVDLEYVAKREMDRVDDEGLRLAVQPQTGLWQAGAAIVEPIDGIARCDGVVQHGEGGCFGQDFDADGTGVVVETGEAAHDADFPLAGVMRLDADQGTDPQPVLVARFGDGAIPTF